MKNARYLIIAVIFGVVVFFVLRANRLKAKESGEKVAAANAAFSEVPVTVYQVKREEVKVPISLIGTVNAFADYNLQPEASGRVLAINGKVGDYLPTGALFVKLDDEIPQANYQYAAVNYEKAKRDMARYQTLATQSATTDLQLANAKLTLANAEATYLTAKRNLSNTNVKIPAGGVIASRNVEVGSTIVSGVNATTIANIIDISRLKVKVQVPEEDVFKLKIGDPATVTTDVYQGKSFTGQVYTISDKADDAHTYSVEILLANDRQTPLKAGMFAQVGFRTLPQHNVVVIPRGALVGSAKDASVYVVENKTAHLRPVRVGQELGERLVISAGLQPGEMVVIDGQNNLTENTKVSAEPAQK